MTDVPHDGDLGVRKESLRHDLGRAQLGLSDEDVDVRGVLREVW